MRTFLLRYNFVTKILRELTKKKKKKRKEKRKNVARCRSRTLPLRWAHLLVNTSCYPERHSGTVKNIMFKIA